MRTDSSRSAPFPLGACPIHRARPGRRSGRSGRAAHRLARGSWQRAGGVPRRSPPQRQGDTAPCSASGSNASKNLLLVRSIGDRGRHIPEDRDDRGGVRNRRRRICRHLRHLVKSRAMLLWTSRRYDEYRYAALSSVSHDADIGEITLVGSGVVRTLRIRPLERAAEIVGVVAAHRRGSGASACRAAEARVAKRALIGVHRRQAARALIAQHREYRCGAPARMTHLRTWTGGR